MRGPSCTVGSTRDIYGIRVCVYVFFFSFVFLFGSSRAVRREPSLSLFLFLGLGQSSRTSHGVTIYNTRVRSRARSGITREKAGNLSFSRVEKRRVRARGGRVVMVSVSPRAPPFGQRSGLMDTLDERNRDA